MGVKQALLRFTDQDAMHRTDAKRERLPNQRLQPSAADAMMSRRG
jgi:hypothetical protein